MPEDLTPVHHNPEAARFELRAAEAIAIAEYRLMGTDVEFHHTSVPSELEGRGIGSRLARAALDSARERGLNVIPTCSFFAAYIRRHPEYQDLVIPSLRTQLGIGNTPVPRSEPSE